MGELSLPTVGYGLGNWHLVHGRTEESTRIFRLVIAEPQWAAFGYIAAEAELAAQQARRRSRAPPLTGGLPKTPYN